MTGVGNKAEEEEEEEDIDAVIRAQRAVWLPFPTENGGAHWMGRA